MKLLRRVSPLAALLILLGAAAHPQTTFTEVSGPAGVAQTTPTWGGVSWGDVNNDGLEDVYASNHHYFPDLVPPGVQTPPTLFLNNGDGTFRDVSTEYGLLQRGDNHGAVWADSRNDGFPELFQSQGGQRGQGSDPNRFYRNLGDGVLTDIAVAAGLEMGRSRGRGAFWFDYDRDGLLDIYVCNEALTGYPSTLLRNNGNDTFTDVGSQTGLQVSSAIMGAPVDYNGDGLVDVYLNSLTRVWLFRNNGDGTFTDVTAAVGLGGSLHPKGFAWGDVDNDGDLDLYLAVGAGLDEFQSDSQAIYYNCDVLRAETKGADFATTGSTVTFDLYEYQWKLDPTKIYIGSQGFSPTSIPFTLNASDPALQGQPPLAPVDQSATYIWKEGDVWYFRGYTSNLLSGTTGGGAISTDGTFSAVQPYMFDIVTGDMPNLLFENMGGTFVETGAAAGVRDVSNSMATVMADFDNDGRLDLFVVNRDRIFNAPDKLYMNNGDGTFAEAAAASGVAGDQAGRGENAEVADYDNNGFPDIFVANGYGGAPFSFGPHRLYRNEGNANHWLKAKLQGTISNRDGIGARVSANVGGQIRGLQQTGGAARMSQNTMILHLGLGPYASVSELSVSWPSGVVQTLRDVAADRMVTVVEPGVDLTAVPSALTYKPGDKLVHTVTLTNGTNIDLSAKSWSHLTRPDGNTYPQVGELLGPFAVSVPAGATRTKKLSVTIPSTAPAGTYTYTVFVGPYPNGWASSSFVFTIAP